MIMNKTHIAFIIFAGFFLFLPQYTLAETIRYQNVAPIFNERCILCHAGPGASNGFQMETYQNLIKGGNNGVVIIPGEAENSELYKRIKGTSQPRMPLTGPPFLSNDQTELIAQWINQGALDSIVEDNLDSTNTTASTTLDAGISTRKQTADSGQVTFDDVKSIFIMRCMKCHSPNGIMGSPPENYLMDNYQNILSANDRARIVPGNPAASELIRRIRGQSLPRMPLDGPPYLNDDETSLIEKWVEQGARDEDGLKATIPTGAKIRLHGRYTARWNLDGNLPFKITGNTRIKKSPNLGDYVQLRGRLDTDGNIIADRLRRRD